MNDQSIIGIIFQDSFKIIAAIFSNGTYFVKISNENTTSDYFCDFIHSILNMQEIFGEVPCYPKKPFSNKIRCSMLFKINFLSIFYSIEQEKIKMF